MENKEIDNMYENSAKISDKIVDMETRKSCYLDIMKGGEQSDQELRLCSQLITKHFSVFPDQMDKAFDRMLSMLEGSEGHLRQQLIHDLPIIAKLHNPRFGQAAAAIVRSLDSEAKFNLNLTHKALTTMLEHDMRETFNALFEQIIVDTSFTIRHRAINFLLTKIPSSVNEISSNKELEKFVIESSKNALDVADAKSYIGLIQFLQKFKSMQTLVGRQELIGYIAGAAKLNELWQKDDTDRLVFLLSCIQQALPLFSKNVHSTQFLVFMVDNVCPVLYDMDCSLEEKREILRLMAELSTFCGPDMTEPVERLIKVHGMLDNYLVSPPDETACAQGTNDPQYQLSLVECALYLFHSLCKIADKSFWSSPNNTEMIRVFKLKLQYLGQAVQHYLRSLKLLASNSEVKLTDKMVKNKEISISVCENIRALTRDFFHSPPAIKTLVIPSWHSEKKLPSVSPASSASTSPRTSKFSGSGTKNNEQGRTERQIYNPGSRIIYTTKRQQRDATLATTPLKRSAATAESKGTPEMIRRRQRFANDAAQPAAQH